MENVIELHKGNISRKSISNDVLSKTVCYSNVEHLKINVKVKVKQSRYRPGVAQRVPGS
jgi:hypothetical protein